MALSFNVLMTLNLCWSEREKRNVNIDLCGSFSVTQVLWIRLFCFPDQSVQKRLFVIFSLCKLDIAHPGWLMICKLLYLFLLNNFLEFEPFLCMGIKFEPNHQMKPNKVNSIVRMYSQSLMLSFGSYNQNDECIVLWHTLHFTSEQHVQKLK